MHFAGRTAVVSLAATQQPLRMIDLSTNDVSGILPLPRDWGQVSDTLIPDGIWVHKDEAMALYPNGIALWDLTNQSLTGSLPAKGNINFALIKYTKGCNACSLMRTWWLQEDPHTVLHILADCKCGAEKQTNWRQ
jgi:hypothetical protein